MKLHELPSIVATKKSLGRGHGKRGGKSGRGQKGQKSRAGYSRKAGFEGGQTPLYMRLPKGRGMKQKFPSQVEKPLVVTMAQLKQFADGAIVGPGALKKAGLLKKRHQHIKLIGNDALKHKLTIRVHKVSVGAQKAVEKAGGKVEILAR
jgi:large subunit ribosomal protein L15